MANGKGFQSFRTHEVAVECFVASDDELTRLQEEERGANRLLRVLWLKPMVAGSPGFVGRWDEKATSLDFDAVDDRGNVDKAVAFDGHHPTPLPERRFAVEIRFPQAGRLIFAGIVSFGLGFDVALREELHLQAEVIPDAEVIRPHARAADSA